jgi:hypothetical protein
MQRRQRRSEGFSNNIARARALNDRLARKAGCRNQVKWSILERRLEAGLNPGYLYGVVVSGQDPTIDRFLKIAEALGISAGEILDGRPLSPGDKRMLELWSRETETLLKNWSRASRDTRRVILRLLENE